jgi:hypothetical protein
MQRQVNSSAIFSPQSWQNKLAAKRIVQRANSRSVSATSTSARAFCYLLFV